MTWVKVCGMTKESDLEAAEAAGADAVGLVLVEDTPRFLELDRAARLAAATPVPAIILTLDASPEKLLRLLERVGAAGVQPYGQHVPEATRAAAGAGALVLRPIRVRGPVELGSVPSGQMALLDAYSPHSLGGTGHRVDPRWLPPPGSPYVLAGGLDPSNVAGAVTRYRPWGVDASSGLESAPGVKDPARIHDFVSNAKQAGGGL